MRVWRNGRGLPQSHYYDHNLIRARLVKLKQLESETDLMHFLGTGMIRNLGGISNYRLFNQYSLYYTFVKLSYWNKTSHRRVQS